MNELQMKVEQKVYDCLFKISEVLNRKGRSINIPQIKINFKNLGRTAGHAFQRTNVLEFNTILLKENADKFIERTVPHEVAHLITAWIFPLAKKPHGKEWKSVMKMLGVKDSTRCHDFDVTNSTLRKVERKFKYQCKCQIHMMTAITNNRLKRGLTYYCKKCRTQLKPVQ